MNALNKQVEADGLRDLSAAEVDSVGGGVAPIVIAIVGGFIGAAVYDAFEDELGAAVEAVGDALSTAGRAMQED